MKTYVINLKTSENRRIYMENLLSPYKDILDVCFVEAVDGRILTDKQLSSIWNLKGSYKTYGRFLRKGEIGCALSHKKCYREMLKSREDVALILEDDVVFQCDNVNEIILSTTDFLLHTEQATIVLLSGSYWFTEKVNIDNEYYHLAIVREAMGAMSYMINRKAAEKMVQSDNIFFADDWYNFRKQGIAIYAVNPHIAADAGVFASEILSGEGIIRKNISIPKKVRSYYRAVVRRILGGMGHFEKRI